MKVVWVMKEFGIGGAERLLLELAHRLPDIEFVPVAVVDRPHDLVAYLEEAGMSPVSLGARGPFDISWLSRLRRVVKVQKPDVVHVQNPYPAAGARIALRGLKVPLVYTEHNVWQSFHPATRIANMLTFWLNDVSVAVSHGVTRSIEAFRLGRYYSKNVITIPNGIDPEVVRRDASRSTDVSVAAGSYGTVTHLNHSKAPDVLLAASAILRDRGVEADCYVVGDGVLARDVQRQRRDLALDRVHLLGMRPDARAILARLDVFVISSRFEGLPMVLLEALALGVPVVATRAGGIGEVITDRKTGLLVPQEDPAALASAIEEVLSDEDLAHDIAAAGRELVETTFHIDSTASSLRRVYEKAAAR